MHIKRMRASGKDMGENVRQMLDKFKVFIYIAIRQKHRISVVCYRLGHCQLQVSMVVIGLDADHAHKARLVGLRYILGMQRSVSPDKVRMLVNVVENFRNQVKHRRRNQSYKSLSSDPQNLVD